MTRKKLNNQGSTSCEDKLVDLGLPKHRVPNWPLVSDGEWAVNWIRVEISFSMAASLPRERKRVYL